MKPLCDFKCDRKRRLGDFSRAISGQKRRCVCAADEKQKAPLQRILREVAHAWRASIPSPECANLVVWFESVAQLVEHRPFKALVLGSSPSALTIKSITYRRATQSGQRASDLPKVIAMETPNGPLQLLRQKRSSAMIDVGNIEARLTCLSNSTATAGIKTSLLCIAGMFREYIATLDEAIATAVVC